MHYKYLGIVFNSRLTWKHAIKELAGKANKAVSMIRRVMWKLGAFDSLVVSILCYGSRVWGYEYHTKIEQVHINFCKLVVGVRKYASNSAVLSECGRLTRAKIYQILAKNPKWIMNPSHGSAMRKCIRLTDKLGNRKNNLEQRPG